jgi:hypothetical protein
MINDQWEYRRDSRATVQATLDSQETRMPLLDSKLTEIKIPTLIIWRKQTRLSHLNSPGSSLKAVPGQSWL